MFPKKMNKTQMQTNNYLYFIQELSLSTFSVKEMWIHQSQKTRKKKRNLRLYVWFNEQNEQRVMN